MVKYIVSFVDGALDLSISVMERGDGGKGGGCSCSPDEIGGEK